MNVKLLRHELVDRLTSCAPRKDDYVPYHPECSLCHRKDTEGCINVFRFNGRHYANCRRTKSVDAPVLNGTLFLTTRDTVVCAECIRALGWRGKGDAYGITLSMLILAGGRLSHIIPFWRARYAGKTGRHMCEYSGDVLNPNWHMCDVCYILWKKSWMLARRPCNCKALPPVLPPMPPPVSPQKVKSLTALTLMALPTADLGAVRQLEVCLA